MNREPCKHCGGVYDAHREGCLESFINRECVQPTLTQYHHVDMAASSFDTTTSMLHALALWHDKEGYEVSASLIRDFIRTFATHEKDS